jgi:hypothetical protein
MWSDSSRKAAADARKANGHNAGKGNRAVAQHVADQHVAVDQPKSVSGGIIKGAGAGAVIGGAIGAAALHRYGGARIGAKLGAIAGAKVGAVAGGVYRYATRK